MTPARPEWWNAYIGGAYAFRGRCLAAGIDCWGLVVRVLADEFGLAVDDFGARYAGPEGRVAAKAAIAAELPGWREVTWEEGAVALMIEGGKPSHVGICTVTRGIVLHAHHSVGVNLLDIPRSVRWKDRLVGCYLPR